MIFSESYISGMILKYKLPTGEVVESKHFLQDEKEQTDNIDLSSMHQIKVLALEPDESIVKLSFGYTSEGITLILMTTDKDNQIHVEGTKSSVFQRAVDYDFSHEKRIVAGFKTTFEDGMVEMSCYLTTV